MFAVRGDDEVDVPVGMACVRGVTNVLTKWINLESLTETWRRWRPYVNQSERCDVASQLERVFRPN